MLRRRCIDYYAEKLQDLHCYSLLAVPQGAVGVTAQGSDRPLKKVVRACALIDVAALPCLRTREQPLPLLPSHETVRSQHMMAPHRIWATHTDDGSLRHAPDAWRSPAGETFDATFLGTPLLPTPRRSDCAARTWCAGVRTRLLQLPQRARLRDRLADELYVLHSQRSQHRHPELTCINRKALVDASDHPVSPCNIAFSPVRYVVPLHQPCTMIGAPWMHPLDPGATTRCSGSEREPREAQLEVCAPKCAVQLGVSSSQVPIVDADHSKYPRFDRAWSLGRAALAL